MIHIHIEANTPAEIRSHLEGLLAASAGGSTQAETASPKKTAKPSHDTKTEVKVETKAAEAPKAVETSKTQTEAPAPVNGEAIGVAIAKIAKVKGKQAAIDLLAKYGAKRGQEVKAEDYSKFVSDANTLLAA